MKIDPCKRLFENCPSLLAAGLLNIQSFHQQLNLELTVFYSIFPSIIYTNGGRRLKLNNLWPAIGAVLEFTPFCFKKASSSQIQVIQHVLFGFLVSGLGIT